MADMPKHLQDYFVFLGGTPEQFDWLINSETLPPDAPYTEAEVEVITEKADEAVVLFGADIMKYIHSIVQDKLDSVETVAVLAALRRYVDIFSSRFDVDSQFMFWHHLGNLTCKVGPIDLKNKSTK